MDICKRRRWLLAGALCLTSGLVWGMAPTVMAETVNVDRVVKSTSTGNRVIDFSKSDKTARTTAAQPAAAKPAETSESSVSYIHNVRLMWQEVPSAVSYQVVILKSVEDTDANIVMAQDQIFTNGVDINLSRFGHDAGNFYWKVCPLDYNGKPVGNGHFSKPQPITSGSKLEPKAPQPTTQYDRMDYMPVYPVYSWIPYDDAKHHEVQVYRVTDNGDNLVRTLNADQ